MLEVAKGHCSDAISRGDLETAAVYAEASLMIAEELERRWPR
jgi:hypothetical protein